MMSGVERQVHEKAIGRQLKARDFSPFWFENSKQIPPVLR
jgi:hypothetical protein